MRAWIADLRFACRGLRHQPAFAAVVLLTLGVGLGVLTVLGVTLARTALPVATGLVLGMAISAGVAKTINRFLFEVEAFDPAVLGAVVTIFLASALFAAWGPARRATRVDPMVVLRQD